MILAMTKADAMIEHQMMVAVTVVFIVFTVVVLGILVIHMIGHGGKDQ